MSGHVLDQLTAYLDDELVPGDRSQIEAHLKECPACARHLEQLAAVDVAARALPAEPPESYFDDFSARVRDRLQPRPVAKRAWRMPAWTLAAAAALALAVLTPLLVRRQQQAPLPAASAEKPTQVDRASVAPEVQAQPPATPAPSDRLAAKAAEAAPPAAAPVAQAVPKRPNADEKRDFASGEAATVPSAAPEQESAGTGRLENAVPESVAGGVMGGVSGGPPGAAAGNVGLRDAEPRRKDALAKQARDEPRQQAEESTADKSALAGAGFAAPPAPAAAAPAPQAPVKLREGKAEAQAPPAPPASFAPEPQSRFRELLARKATSAAEARALREDWRALAGRTMGAEADEARVRTIEAGVVAYGLSHDAADLARLRSDAMAYLQRPDAPQATRVRALVRSVGAE